jgi:Protein of unknown function (DUF3551)
MLLKQRRIFRHKGEKMGLLVLAATLYSASAFAQVPTQYPFCLQGDDYPGWSNCTFTGFQECQASASGISDECLANPWYSAADAEGQAPGGNTASQNSPLPVGPPPD